MNKTLMIPVTKVVEYDEKTKTYTMYCKEFPRAMAVGETEQQAEDSLIPLIQLMWKEEFNPDTYGDQQWNAALEAAFEHAQKYNGYIDTSSILSLKR